MSTEDKEVYLAKAKLAEQAERYDDMAKVNLLTLIAFLCIFQHN